MPVDRLFFCITASSDIATRHNSKGSPKILGSSEIEEGQVCPRGNNEP